MRIFFKFRLQHTRKGFAGNETYSQTYSRRVLVVGEPLVQLVDVLLREPDVVLDVPQLKFCLIPFNTNNYTSNEVD